MARCRCIAVHVRRAREVDGLAKSGDCRGTITVCIRHRRTQDGRKRSRPGHTLLFEAPREANGLSQATTPHGRLRLEGRDGAAAAKERRLHAHVLNPEEEALLQGLRIARHPGKGLCPVADVELYLALAVQSMPVLEQVAIRRP